MLPKEDYRNLQIRNAELELALQSLNYLHQAMCDLPQGEYMKKLLKKMGEILGDYPSVKQPELIRILRDKLGLWE